MLDDVTIWQGDSRELISRLPDASVDLICTDPPYNLGGYSTGNIKMAWRSDFNNDVADWDQLAFEPAEWLAEFRRYIEDEGVGQIPEVFDGDAPQRPGGCIAQAWSVAELFRCLMEDI